MQKGPKGKLKIDIRSFEEAARWAHTLKLRTVRDWWKYIDSNPLPDDIPRQPHTAYTVRGTWKGWDVFLGSTASGVHEVMENSIICFALVNSLDDPRNVFSVFGSSTGEDELVHKIRKAGYTLIQVFRIKEAKQEIFKRHLESLKTTYFGGEDKIMMANPYEEIARLEDIEASLNK